MDDWEMNIHSCRFTEENVEDRDLNEGYSNGVLQREGLPDKNCSFVPVKGTELLLISSNVERLVGSDTVLSIYGILSHRTQHRYLLVTDRIDSSLDQWFKNTGDPYDKNGFLKPSVTDKVRDLLRCFSVLCNKNIKHSGGRNIQATQMFVVKGKVRLLYVTIHSPHEKWNRMLKYSTEQLKILFPRLLKPQDKILVKQEYTHFCQINDYFKEKVGRHPLLLSPWERLAIPAHVHCRILADENFRPDLFNRFCIPGSWTANISPNSITGVILAHRTYKDSAQNYLDFLRNFVEHVFQQDTLEKYHHAIGDKTNSVKLPSIVEMNQLLASQIGDSYLLNIFDHVGTKHWK